MKFKTSLVALSISATLLPHIAQAQDEDIEIITVTASRMDKPVSSIPNTVTIIDQEQFEEQFSHTKDLSTIIDNLAQSFHPRRP